MNKYINIMLMSVFGVLSIKCNMGLTFFIPFVFYYSYKNIKNLMLIIPFSFVSIFFFKVNNYVLFILLYIPLLLLLLLVKKKKDIYVIGFAFLINVIDYFLFKKTNHIISNIYFDIASIIICPIILMFLIYNSKTQTDIHKEIRSIAYNEVMLAFVLSLCSIYYAIYDIPIGIILSIYFAMYFSSNKYIFSMIIFSLVNMFCYKYFFEINYSILIPIVAFIYLIPSFLSSITMVVILMYTLFFEPNILNINMYYVLGILGVLFEILRPFIINTRNKVEVINNVYERTISQIDNEVEAFSLFLDKIVNNLTNNEYNNELMDAISLLSKNVCLDCKQRNECFTKNKGKLYYHYKNTILNNYDDFICARNEEMKRVGRNLGNNLINKSAYVNDLLAPLLNSVSNILRQYKIDHNINIEMDFNILNNLKEGLEDYGYSLSMFNVIKSFKNDFLIEVGLIGINYYEEKENIENVSSHYLKTEANIIFKEMKKNKTYITIIPKVNYEIIYGYGSMSKLGNSICGDNYLVKENKNGKLVAAICDGMGKGLSANIQSSRTLKLLDEITNTNMTSETSLQILNSFYYIEDYQEKFSTLDFVEIDKRTGEMLLYKAGATFTYIIKETGEMIKIENENLPFGLNELVISKKINLDNQDLIIMASDGIFDNIVNVSDFETFINSIKNFDPQKISYELLNYARHTDLISKDDMSVIALKIKIV